jgi:valyl-tRNA synthetase
MYLAAEKLYHYAWHSFADFILEESKIILQKGSIEEVKSRKQFLLHTLSKILISLHPFIPFVTEEIWKDMPIDDKKMLIIEDWPV